MILGIEIKEKTIKISLKNGRNILDSAAWSEDHNLSYDLLPKVNNMIKKNNVAWKDLKDAKLKSDLDENFTTYRIAKSLAEAIKFFIKNKEES